MFLILPFVDFRRRPSPLPSYLSADQFNEVPLFAVNYTVAVYMSRMRSPMYEGLKVRDEYRELTEALSWGLGMCVQTTERFIKQVPGLTLDLFSFTQKLSA